MKPFTVQEAEKYKRKLAPNRAAGLAFESMVGHLLLGALGMCIPLGFLVGFIWLVKTIWNIV